MSVFHRFKEWIKYKQRALSRHGVHSPFVYQFMEHALHNSPQPDLPGKILHYFKEYDIVKEDWDLENDKTENTLIILSHIHQTKENTERWNVLIAHPQIRLSIDLYDVGLLFFRKAFIEKQHFVLQQ